MSHLFFLFCHLSFFVHSLFCYFAIFSQLLLVDSTSVEKQMKQNCLIKHLKKVILLKVEYLEHEKHAENCSEIMKSFKTSAMNQFASKNYPQKSFEKFKNCIFNELTSREWFEGVMLFEVYRDPEISNIEKNKQKIEEFNILNKNVGLAALSECIYKDSLKNNTDKKLRKANKLKTLEKFKSSRNNTKKASSQISKKVIDDSNNYKKDDNDGYCFHTLILLSILSFFYIILFVSLYKTRLSSRHPFEYPELTQKLLKS